MENTKGNVMKCPRKGSLQAVRSALEHIETLDQAYLDPKVGQVKEEWLETRQVADSDDVFAAPLENKLMQVQNATSNGLFECCPLIPMVLIIRIIRSLALVCYNII